jgi:hypothetical protein
LESLDESFDINNALESIRENIKTSAKDNLGYHRPKNNKPWQITVVEKFKPNEWRQSSKLKT